MWYIVSTSGLGRVKRQIARKIALVHPEPTGYKVAPKDIFDCTGENGMGAHGSGCRELIMDHLRCAPSRSVPSLANASEAATYQEEPK